MALAACNVRQIYERGGVPTIGHCPVSIAPHQGRHNIAAAAVNMNVAAKTFVKYFQKLKLVCTSNVAHSFGSFVSMGIHDRTH